jgi:hypothetical protein
MSRTLCQRPKTANRGVRRTGTKAVHEMPAFVENHTRAPELTRSGNSTISRPDLEEATLPPR